ncbi:GAF domain-containing protein [Nocardia wallacei]|uniref:GAF domain-containing protein n=1 Tax=Nocardia wallacei TaxID=480035 RepID=UPI002458DBB3|nr:GAF domain-containing protein [Nocardia wallacei]
MVSNLTGDAAPQHDAQPEDRLGALETHAAQAHRHLAAGGEHLHRLPGLLRPPILDSWLRSVRDGVDPAGDLDERGLRGADLRRYRDGHAISAVLPLVHELLLQDAARVGVAVVVADQYGRALWVLGNPRRVAAVAESGLREGDDLSERRIGANAIGLVVRTGRATWIHGPEHVLHRLHPITGAAAPVHDPRGRLVGVLMIAGGIRVARPEILALVKATATAAELELRLAAVRAVPAPDCAATVADSSDTGRLGLELLGLGQPQLKTRAGRITLSQRHAEILLLLSEHPAGLSSDHLALLLDDADLGGATIRAAMSRLRGVVGSQALGSRPYRLRATIGTDVAALRTALDAGDVAAAVRAYAGPVLPRSAAPGVMDIREEMRVRLRAAVLGSGDPAVLSRWTAGPDGRDDAAAWLAYRAVVDRESELYTQIEAKIRLLDRRAAADPIRARHFGA